MYDASHWYNRNLAIIANIERHFLEREDVQKIHPYFWSHRKPGDMIAHLRLQWCLGAAIIATVMIYHFLTRVRSNWRWDIKGFDPEKALSYAVLLACAIAIALFRHDRLQSYRYFIERAPGIPVARIQHDNKEKDKRHAHDAHL